MREQIMVIDEIVKRTANEIMHKDMSPNQQSDFISTQYELYKEDMGDVKFNGFMLMVYQIIDN